MVLTLVTTLHLINYATYIEIEIMRNRQLTYLAFIGLSLMMTSCGQGPQPAAQVQPVEGIRMGTDYQKPGAPIRMGHDYDGNTSLNTPEIINLVFFPAFDVERLTIDLSSSSDDLAVAAVNYDGPASANNPVSIPVTVSSGIEGRYFINMQVATDKNGYKSGRAFSLQVVVGNPPSQKADTTKELNGERIRVLSTEENTP